MGRSVLGINKSSELLFSTLLRLLAKPFPISKSAPLTGILAQDLEIEGSLASTSVESLAYSAKVWISSPLWESFRVFARKTNNE